MRTPGGALVSVLCIDNSNALSVQLGLINEKWIPREHFVLSNSSWSV